jgi:endonuclease/exonuclease/phosphatase family metal-dependent hydrolase
MSADEIIAENFAAGHWLSRPPDALRIVDWNINRGLKLPAIMEFLASTDADVFTLQEVDMNTRRTHRHNIAGEIARKLRLNYVFGCEFLEIAQGTKAHPAFQGQATLSRWNIANARVLRFPKQSDFWKPRWFKPKLESFQERLGGRIALVAEISIVGTSILCYNLHLESRGRDELRLAQLYEVLRDTGRYDPSRRILVAGDLNLDASKTETSNSLERAGFRVAVPTTRVPTTPARHLLEAGRHIDWAFVRGAADARGGTVHSWITASDHYPLSFDLVV